VIGNEWVGNCKSNYHRSTSSTSYDAPSIVITTTTTPARIYFIWRRSHRWWND